MLKIAILQSITEYFTESRKIKQSWTRPENSDICFCISFDRYSQKLFFGGKTGQEPVYPHNFEIFSFPNFQDPKLFGNSYTKFIILDIKFPFTCCELNFHGSILKLQRYYVTDYRYFKNTRFAEFPWASIPGPQPGSTLNPDPDSPLLF